MTEQRVARIFEDTDGYHICDDSLYYLDARGYAYRSRREAIAAARNSQGETGAPLYTHYIGADGKARRI